VTGYPPGALINLTEIGNLSDSTVDHTFYNAHVTISYA
jgi:hypothetical protein